MLFRSASDPVPHTQIYSRRPVRTAHCTGHRSQDPHRAETASRARPACMCVSLCALRLCAEGADHWCAPARLRLGPGGGEGGGANAPMWVGPALGRGRRAGRVVRTPACSGARARRWRVGACERGGEGARELVSGGMREGEGRRGAGLGARRVLRSLRGVRASRARVCGCVVGPDARLSRSRAGRGEQRAQSITHSWARRLCARTAISRRWEFGSLLGPVLANIRIRRGRLGPASVRAP